MWAVLVSNERDGESRLFGVFPTAPAAATFIQADWEAKKAEMSDLDGAVDAEYGLYGFLSSGDELVLQWEGIEINPPHEA